MTARPLGAAVLIEGEHLRSLRYAVAVAVRAKRANGTSPGPLLTELDTVAAHALSQTRQNDEPAPPTPEQLKTLVSTSEVAKALGMSTRSIQRLAPSLDAHRIGGRWMFDPDTVHEYKTQRKAHHG